MREGIAKGALVTKFFKSVDYWQRCATDVCTHSKWAQCRKFAEREILKWKRKLNLMCAQKKEESG